MDLYYTEIGGVIFAVLYIIAAAREKNSCWLLGIISSLLWAHASYFHFHLYIDPFMASTFKVALDPLQILIESIALIPTSLTFTLCGLDVFELQPTLRPTKTVHAPEY